LGLTRVRHRPADADPSRWGSLLGILGRLAAGAAAGGIVLGAFAVTDGETRVAPMAVFAAVALAVGAFPRLGWLGTAVALIAWLAAQGDTGLALVVLAAAVPVPLLLMRAGPLWSLPVLAPLLAAAGLGPLYLVVAGAPRSAWRRAALGAIGFLWLALAEAALQRTLLFGPADGSMPLRAWQGSLPHGAQDAIWPLLSTPALLPAAAWAVLAAVLPLLVTGRSLTLDLLGGFVWAAGIVAAHQAMGPVLGAEDPRGLAAGTVIAVVVAVAAAGAGLRRPAPDAADLPRMAVP
jgi:hypothetical protein